MGGTDRKLLDDFFAFSRLHMESGDVDPLYPVLKHVLASEPNEDQRAWQALTYVAFYNLPSALRWLREPALVAGPSAGLFPGMQRMPRDWDPSRAYLPTGVERRSLRGGVNMVRHLQSVQELAAQHGGYRGWLTHRFEGNPATDWFRLQEAARQAWGNGRWAAYKTAEVAQKVLGLPVEPADMGNAGSTGPRKGLELLFGTSASVAELDAWGNKLMEVGTHSWGILWDLAEVETCLCDFHSMVRGHYYVGHDIDQLQGDVEKAVGEREQASMLALDLMLEVYEARASTLRVEYLGEQGGWVGVDKERAGAYKDRGLILARH